MIVSGAHVPRYFDWGKMPHMTVIFVMNHDLQHSLKQLFSISNNILINANCQGIR